MLRSLIDRIALHPRGDGGVDAMLRGDLAEILNFAMDPIAKENSPKPRFREVNSRWLRGEDLNL